MDKLRLEVDWDVDNPKLKADMERSRREIEGVGQTVDAVEKKTVKNIEAMVSRNQQLDKTYLQLKIQAQSYANIVAKTADPAVIAKYNAKLEETQVEMRRISNLGKSGFDDMGNAIKQSTVWNNGLIRGLSRTVEHFRRLAYIIPGLGITGVFMMAWGPLSRYVMKLGEADEKTKALNKTMQAFESQVSRQIAETNILVGRIQDSNSSMEVRQRLLNDFISTNPSVLNALTLQNISQAEGTRILDEYIARLRTKLELQQLEKAYADSIQRESDLASGSLSEETDFKWYNRTARHLGNMLTFRKNYKETLKEIDEINEGRRQKAVEEQQTITAAYEDKIKAIVEGQGRVEDAEDTSLQAMEQSLASVNKRLMTLQAGQSDQQLQHEKELLEKRIAERRKMLGLETKQATATADATIKQREALLEKLATLESDFSRRAMSKDEAELQALRDRFAKVAVEVQKFNADPKNKIKIPISELEDIRDQALTDLRYSHDTTNQAKVYEQDLQTYLAYEKLKEDAGKEYADKRFANELEAIKTFEQKLQSEIDTLLGLPELSALEAERLKAYEAILTKLTDHRDKEADREFIAERQNFQKLLSEYATYEQKRQRIIAESEDKIKKLRADGRNKEADEVEKETPQLLFDLDKSAVEALAEFQKIYDELDRLGVKGKNVAIAAAKKAFESFKSEAKLSSEEMERLNALFLIYLDNLQSANTEEWANGIVGISHELSGIVQQISSIDGSFGNTLQFLGQMGQSYKKIADVIGALGDTIKESGKSSGNMWVAIIGSVLELVGTVWSAISGWNKARREAEEASKRHQQEYIDNAIHGELEYQRLLRERELIAASAGKTSYNALIAQLDALKKQSPEIERLYNRIFASLQGGEFVDGVGTRHGTWFRKSKSWDIMASLAGSDYDRLEQLYEQGKLKDQAKRDFESLRALREELEELGVSIEQIQEELNQLLTGTTGTQLASGLADLLANGKATAAQLGESFEEILRNAIRSSFQAKFLEDAMQPFYEELAEMMKSGQLTEEEIEKLKQRYIDLGEEYAKQWEDIERITGRDLSDDSSSSGMSGRIQSITQQQADVLAGQVMGIHLAVVRGQELSQRVYEVIAGNANDFRDALLYWQAIEQNTAKTATNTNRLERIEYFLEKISKGNNNSLRAGGN